MPSGDKNTTGADLSALLEGLAEADVEFILVGGLAAVVQGSPLTTMDVDIVHNRSSGNITRLIGFLKSIDAVYRRPDDNIIQPTEADLSQMGHMLFSTRFVDVLAFIEERKFMKTYLNIRWKFRSEAIPFAFWDLRRSLT